MKPESNPDSICVVVLGPYRSGTSVTARVLQGLGVNFGPDSDMFEGNRHNPGGYYERRDINRANTQFIQSAGGTLAMPGNPNEIAIKGNANPLRSLNLEWIGQSTLWGIKDPRMCATLPAWLHLNLLSHDRTRIIHVTRKPDATTQSLLALPQVRSYCDGTKEGARQVVQRYMDMAREVTQSSGLPVFNLCYETLTAQPLPTTQLMAEFIGVTDPALAHQASRAVGRRRSLVRLWCVEYPRRGLRRIARAVATSRS